MTYTGFPRQFSSRIHTASALSLRRRFALCSGGRRGRVPQHARGAPGSRGPKARGAGGQGATPPPLLPPLLFSSAAAGAFQKSSRLRNREPRPLAPSSPPLTSPRWRLRLRERASRQARRRAVKGKESCEFEPVCRQFFFFFSLFFSVFFERQVEQSRQGFLQKSCKRSHQKLPQTQYQYTRCHAELDTQDLGGSLLDEDTGMQLFGFVPYIQPPLDPAARTRAEKPHAVIANAIKQKVNTKLISKGNEIFQHRAILKNRRWALHVGLFKVHPVRNTLILI
ncbi:uncharacterized protein LOC128335607 [Hemicordylus capensis]|uniref:uncharacterized protein LOC128335607 n=1 Tax=Hemicordylus capensis TaxID=884348 RepID=UPI0023042861|nr:uncharacterized protein LOC128335607 [Hemicordylus capensis]